MTRLDDRSEPTRVLVIDDEPAILRVYSRVLPGVQVITCNGPVEARARLQSDRRFEAIFCDLAMPEGGGARLCREIGARWPELAPLIVVMTAGAMNDEDDAFLASYPGRVLAKPFTPEQVLAAVDECASRARNRND